MVMSWAHAKDYRVERKEEAGFSTTPRSHVLQPRLKLGRETYLLSGKPL